MEQTITCINCPVGCRMTVTLSDSGDFVSVSGNTCPRGASYARQECTLPERMITAVIQAVMTELGRLTVAAPVRMGQVVLPNVLQTGSDIIATRSLD